MSSETAAPGQQPTVLENVRALLPEIRERAEEIEQARAVPRDLAEKLRSAGVFRRYVPRSHGGDEMWPDEGLTVIEELARADASVAWVAAVGSEGPSFYAYLPADTYDKIYAGGPDVIHTGVINATGKAVRVDGGYRFSGRWSFASGSNNADYICIHGVIEDESGDPAGRGPGRLGADRRRLARERAQGHREQRRRGQRPVRPHEWTGSFAELPKIARHPLDQRQLGARFGSEFAAVAIGIAQAALDDITDIAATRSRPRPGYCRCDRPGPTHERGPGRLAFPLAARGQAPGGFGDLIRCRLARCARSRLTSVGSNLSASGVSISSLSSW